MNIIEAIDKKMKTLSFITDPENVFWGEYEGKERLIDSQFPRVECQLHGCDNYDYQNQYSILPIEWVSVSGYVKWDSQTTPNGSAEDAMDRYITILEYCRETEKKLFEFNSDKMLGLETFTGFQRVHPLRHTVIYHEVMSKLSGFFILQTYETCIDYRKIN